jgi:hypothetical protein
MSRSKRAFRDTPQSKARARKSLNLLRPSGLASVPPMLASTAAKPLISQRLSQAQDTPLYYVKGGAARSRAPSPCFNQRSK